MVRSGKGGFLAAQGFADGGTALEGAERRHPRRILGAEIDEALHVSSVVEPDALFVGI
jgi:hypothetical protein